MFKKIRNKYFYFPFIILNSILSCLNSMQNQSLEERLRNDPSRTIYYYYGQERDQSCRFGASPIVNSNINRGNYVQSPQSKILDTRSLGLMPIDKESISRISTYSTERIQAHLHRDWLEHGQYTDFQTFALGQLNLYPCDNYLKFARSLPNYENYVQKLKEEYDRNPALRKALDKLDAIDKHKNKRFHRLLNPFGIWGSGKDKKSCRNFLSSEVSKISERKIQRERAAEEKVRNAEREIFAKKETERIANAQRAADEISKKKESLREEKRIKWDEEEKEKQGQIRLEKEKEDFFEERRRKAEIGAKNAMRERQERKHPREKSDFNREGRNQRARNTSSSSRDGNMGGGRERLDLKEEKKEGQSDVGVDAPKPDINVQDQVADHKHSREGKEYVSDRFKRSKTELEDSSSSSSSGDGKKTDSISDNSKGSHFERKSFPRGPDTSFIKKTTEKFKSFMQNVGNGFRNVGAFTARRLGIAAKRTVEEAPKIAMTAVANHIVDSIANSAVSRPANDPIREQMRDPLSSFRDPISQHYHDPIFDSFSPLGQQFFGSSRSCSSHGPFRENPIFHINRPNAVVVPEINTTTTTSSLTPQERIGMEGFRATGNDGSSIDLERVNELRGYINVSKRLAEELQRSANRSNNLKQTCQVLFALGEVAEGFIESGELDIAQALASTSRYMTRVEGLGKVAVQRTIHGVRNFNPVDLVVASMRLGKSLIKDNYRLMHLMHLSRSGNEALYQRELAEYHRVFGRMFNNANQIISNLQNATLEEIVGFIFENGIDIIITGGLLKLFGKLTSKMISSLDKLEKVVKAEKTAANTLKINSCLEKPSEGIAVGSKLMLEFSPEIAEDIILAIKKNPSLLKQQGKTFVQTAKEIGEKAKARRPFVEVKTETVWEKVNISDLKKIGERSLQKDIRQIIGDQYDAYNFFRAQVESFTERANGVFVGSNENGIIFAYRATSKFGPPTIDINGIKGIRKIKFIKK